MELTDAEASFFNLKGEYHLKKRFDKKRNIHRENKEVNSKIKQPVIKRVRFHRLSEKKK